jgi:hypothetical protein
MRKHCLDVEELRAESFATTPEMQGPLDDHAGAAHLELGIFVAIQFKSLLPTCEASCESCGGGCLL